MIFMRLQLFQLIFIYLLKIAFCNISVEETINLLLFYSNLVLDSIIKSFFFKLFSQTASSSYHFWHKTNYVLFSLPRR